MPSSSLTAAQVILWLNQCADVFTANKDRLTEFDSAIGDGDHGANMARGFAAVKAKLAEHPEVAGDIGAIFKLTAKTLIGTVGGASGPLYGTFFLQGAAPAIGKSELTPAELSFAFDAGLKGIVNLGKAAVGEKTMVDALTPAFEAFRSAKDQPLPEALASAIAAAEKGAESTVPLIAKKGRASYLGERSAGHVDPGAASSVLLLKTLAQAIAAPA